MTSLISTQLLEVHNYGEILDAINSLGLERYLELKKDLHKDDFRESLLP